MTWKGRVHAALAVVVALAVHGATLWAFPRLVMRKVVDEVPVASATERAYFPPPTDHTQRRIVMPSPDLLYATCGYDLAQGLLRVTVHPRLDSYWSVALYADNTDNFAVINDRQLPAAPLVLRLLPPGSAGTGAAPGERVLVAPSMRGLLLMRVLATGERPLAELDNARRTLSCKVEPPGARP